MNRATGTPPHSFTVGHAPPQVAAMRDAVPAAGGWFMLALPAARH